MISAVWLANDHLPLRSWPKDPIPFSGFLLASHACFKGEVFQASLARQGGYEITT